MRTLLCIVPIAFAVVAVAAPARAGEFQLDGEGMAVASTWRGDFGAGGQLRLGYRFARIVAIDLVGWEQYMAVDHRADTGLTFGVSGFVPLPVVRPFARLFFIHQHEEALVSVEDHAFGTVFGVGPGIRHRAGGGGSLGVEIVVERIKRTEFLVIGGGTVTWFPDAALGPDAYFSLFAGLGLSYSIPGLP